MSLSGDLDVLPLLDTLHVLARHRKSGRLTIRTEVADVTITFDRGTVQSVSSSDGSLRIGQVLVDQGYVTEEQIEQALILQEVAHDPNRIGDVLIDVGYVTPNEISRAVAAQLEASLVNVLIQEHGTFEYHLEPDSEEDTHPAPINFEPLVLNATYLADRWLADQKPTEVHSLPEDLIDPRILERLRPHERELLEQLVETYGELHRLAWRIGTSALNMKKGVERLLENVLIRIAVESHEDEHLTGRENARNERIRLKDELVDPWILASLGTNAHRIVLTLLNGETDTISIARQLDLTPEQLNEAIDQLLADDLIDIESRLDGESDEPDGEKPQIQGSDPGWILRPAGTGVELNGLRELPRTEVQIMMAVLNGATSLTEISNNTGLPMSLLEKHASSLIERRYLTTDTDFPDEPSRDTFQSPGNNGRAVSGYR